jgi:two-component system C4-dicarboxylate transport response regulator DctD
VRLAVGLLSQPAMIFARGERPGEIGATLIGSSAATGELREEAEFAARLTVPVMIAGEYGVGKKRLAKLLHRCSLRGRAPFVTVKCGDLPETQLGTRLFGGRDTFTRAGAFERADGGTLFLEDIDVLPPTLQARLMQVLATNVQPVGTGAALRRPNVRLISSTTTPLQNPLTAGGFREDLYYRLNTVYLPISPLRERPEDVDSLLEYFTTYYARRQQVAPPRLTHEWRDLCRAYPWPANVRQLQAVAELLSGSVDPCPHEVFDAAARSLRVTPSMADARANSRRPVADQREAPGQL